MKSIILVFISLFFIACGGGGMKERVLGDGESTDGYITPYTSSNKNSLVDDQFSKYQWFIKNNGLIINEFNTPTYGDNDLNLQNIYKNYLGYNKGNPILVQVVDNGVDYNHEDLKDNMNLNASYNEITRLNDPTPYHFGSDNHGTQVAGIIAAVGYNNLGLKGVAPSANIAGFAFKTTESGSFDIDLETLERAWLSTNNREFEHEISISNNSWGSSFSDSTDEELILKEGSERLRNGKGRLYVFAAGNGRLPFPHKSDSANTQQMSNSQYSITVAAVNSYNRYSSYSSPGSNILVSGYSGEPTLANIPTTMPTGTARFFYETWLEDRKSNYTYSFSGTSAAAPVVSGALALVLEACPDLTYRDIKYLLATKSKRIDTANRTWVLNRAGFSHSNDYGYGLINVEGMIDECRNRYTNLPAKVSLPIVSSTGITTEISDKFYSTRTIEIQRNIKIEWVGVNVSIDSDYLESIQINLISPSGTKSKILHENNQLENSEYEYYDYLKNSFIFGFRLSSVAFVDEDSRGTWKIEIVSFKERLKEDNPVINLGTLGNISLEIVGH